VISAREFCREPGYPITLFLTYSFEPLFFERIGLNDLEVGGSRRIVIVADAEQVNRAMSSCIGQVVHLGRRYVLAETAIRNTFHPKLIARLSPTGGRVWIGSGNLTYTGWGGNRELATAWSIGPGQEDNGSWLYEILAAMNGLVGSTTFAAQADFIRNSAPWIGAGWGSPQEHNVLLGLPSRPLAPQLAQRWQGRRFTKLRVCTGSTDADGAFLAWAQRTFGIKQAVVCLSPAFASFNVAQLEKLPLEIRIVKADADQLMHAKFYWFSGADGDAAVIGSANCSAAAWLAGRSIGNVELVVAYDNARASDFKAILKTFDAKKLTPAQALPSQPAEMDDAASGDANPYRLVSLRLRASGRLIEAITDPVITSDDDAKLVVHGSSGSADIRLTLQGNRLTGRLPPEFQIGSATPFAYAEIASHGTRYVTKPRWLDNEAALERAAKEEVVDPGLRDLSRNSLFSSDHQKILEAVYAVSARLLSTDNEDILTFAGPRGAQGSEGSSAESKEAEDATRAVDPAAIIRSLKDLRSERQAKNAGRPSIYGGTLDGVIAQLFSGADEEQDVDLSRETWSGETLSDEEESANGADGRSQPTASAPTPTEAIMNFHEQIDYFLSELGRAEFAGKCSAKRMVQALAFPLLLCVRGVEAGWLPSRMSATFAARVVEIMFDRNYGRGSPQGLFHRVQNRYAITGKQSEFLLAVGDGTLWAALIASLAMMEVVSLKHVIRYASAISSVFQCKELLAMTNAEHLAVLSAGLIVKNAEDAIADRAPRIAHAVAALNGVLRKNWETIYQEQGKGRHMQPAGSVLWSPAWGWKVLPGTPAGVYCAGYANVETAAAEHQDIKQTIDCLFDAAAVTHADIPDGHVSHTAAY
jgi:HKD family nuclease